MHGFFSRLMRLLVTAMGVALLIGGGWLLSLGGSPYYLAIALALLLTAALMRRQPGAALVVFALLFIGSLAWSFWEAGLDWWPLAARMGALFIVGLLLLLPGAAGHGDGGPSSGRRGAGLLLSGGLLLFAAVAVASWLSDPNTLEGQLPPADATGVASAAAGSGPQAPAVDGVPAGDWHAYGRGASGQRYSPLAQITPANVGQLALAWSYRTGDARGRPGDPEETTFEATPLKIGQRLYFCTPHQSVIALDATTGKQVWRRDLQIRPSLALQHLTCRGLSYLPATTSEGQSPTQGDNQACASMLYMPTADGRLVALDPQNGEPCRRFGNGRGEIDLWAGMPNVKPGAYYSTSPPVVTQKLVIIGGTVLDNASVNEQSGVIRAFDARSGALVWNWDAGNPASTTPLPAGQTYTPNSPNSWSVSSVDEALGMVYVPMGNQPPDQWGGKRSAAVERYSSSVVALDLATGQPRWEFQTVHHDLWDYDVPSQPVLVDLNVKGERVPALVQPTKQGELFVLNRRTGTPVFPVTEVAAPQGAANGDRTAPTQPVSAISFRPPLLQERDMWGATMFDQLACRIAFRRLRYEGRFTPPSEGGSLINPGNFGVFNWGSVAVDPVRHIAFTTPAVLGFTSQLVPRHDDKTLLVQSGGPPKGSLPALNENFGAPYAAKMKPFTSVFGIPCQEPPWGNVAGVDLDTGRITWRHRNGTVRDLSPIPLAFKMGVPSLGGPIVTAGGVAFLSGSMDDYVRAYDVTDGRQLWEQRLPAGGQATPMSYLGEDGRQYLLVVAGGHGSTGTKPGDHVLAFALPSAPPAPGKVAAALGH
jgi:quinoprotein glucose dehydrogenase